MTVQIGELRARFTAEAAQIKAEIQAVKKGIRDLSDQAKQADGSFDALNQALANLGLNANQIKKIGDHIRSTNPQILEKQLEEVRKQLRLLGVDAKQIERIEQEMREATRETANTERAVKSVRGSIEGLGTAITALGAGAAFAGLTRTITTLANETHRLSMSYSGLAEVARATNVDVETAVGLAEELANRWGLNKAVLADTVKTYLTAGLTLEQTRDIIIATADAAVYNREAHLQWDEAIRQVAQGIKMGNSELTDAAGITTNLSVMYERYAKTIGKTAATLTEAEKVQAAYNGIMQESAIFAGNADRAMSGYTGTQATFNQTLAEVRVELGEAFLPVLEDLMETVTPVIREFAVFADENKEVVAGIAAATTAVTGLVAVIGALSGAFLALRAAMGPVGLVITLISGAAAAFGAYKLAADAARDAANDFAESQERINDALRNAPYNLTLEQYKTLQTNMEKLNEVLERRNQLEKEYNERLAAAQSGQGSIENTHRLMELADAIKAVDQELRDMNYKSVEEATVALQQMEKASKESLGAIVALTRESMRETVAHVDNLQKLKELTKQYETLNKQAKLTEAQKAQLAQVVESLKKEYPDLIVLLDEENRWHIKNKEALDEYIKAEENRVNASAEAAKRTLEIAKKEAEERVRLARERLKAIEELEKGQEPQFRPFVSEEMRGFLTTQREQAVEATKRELTNIINQGQFDINEAAKTIDALTVKDWSKFRASPLNAATTQDNGKKKTLEEIQREQYQAALAWIQYRRDLNRMSEQEELAALNRLLERFRKNQEIRRDIEVRIYQLKQQMAKKSFDASVEWIEKEEDRMILAGKTEQEIIRMKMDAWTRLRNRYAKDTEFYKQADEQLRKLQIENLKLVQKAEEEAAKEREKRQKDATKSVLEEIEKAKRAELDALDERRREIQKFYDDQLEAIDDSERLKERNELIAEMEKYRFATSEKGQKRFQELQEELRKMDVEDQKRSLEKQRDQELEALDRRKRDIESWYDDLREATENFTGDLTGLYKLVDDERLASFISTNKKIKEEMFRFQSEMAAIMTGGTGTGSTSAAGSSSQMSAIVQQMWANSVAWHSASAEERRRLEAENQRLGAMIGATYNSREGRWYKDGVPLYHTGGIAGVVNFRSPDILLPDEIGAILRRGEVTLTEKQIGSLVEALSGRGSGDVHIDKIIEVVNAYFDDEIDMRAFGREAGDTAAEILRRKLTGGVGVE